ncbi:MAG: Uma2 family endonuclease [Defluviitaleaceae bacterium]|nr:Uma2 family endonuclease [Defluviitaleaceae bacterium]
MDVTMSMVLYDNEDLGPEMSLEEFENFISLPENQNTTYELVEGHPVMMSGNATTNHQRICGYIARKLGNYLEGKTCEAFQDLNVYLYRENVEKCANVFQPDVMVGCDKDKMAGRGYEGSPELVIEVVSKSTARNDYLYKYMYYMDYGVSEYWIVDMFADQIIVYVNGGENPPTIFKYTFADTVKVGIFEDFSVDFKEISAIIS